MTSTIHCGDALAVLRTLPSDSVRCCVTSPPYFGLRNYDVEGQLGLEKTPEEYVARMVGVFREVRRVLSGDATLWLNLGDSYASNPASGGPGQQEGGEHQHTPDRGYTRPPGLKPKDLCGIPWRVAFALQADGWYLRSEIIWAKPNPMPESVTDRPTKSHEQVFLLSKSASYFWDQEAVKEGAAAAGCVPGGNHKVDASRNDAGRYMSIPVETSRNPRTVWTIATQPFSGAHFAVMPPELARRCIAAGSAPGDVILDPFAGAGTTGLVACQLGRSFIGIELNAKNVAMAERRIRDGGWIPPEKEAPKGSSQPVLF